MAFRRACVHNGRMIGRLGGTPERPAVFFDDAAQFRAWLERHHLEQAELWMGLNAAHVVPRGLTWADAVVEALCFGWIDSVSQRIDAASRRQRWTPRRARSTWSLVNVRHAERLIAEGRMTPAGLAAFAARQPERTGVYSFERPEGELRDDERAELEASSRAKGLVGGGSGLLPACGDGMAGRGQTPGDPGPPLGAGAGGQRVRPADPLAALRGRAGVGATASRDAGAGGARLTPGLHQYAVRHIIMP